MADPLVIVIEAGKSERHYWRDIWRYRELLFFLTWRDLLIRYKQTALGIAWSWLKPLITMLVFTVVFGTLAKLPSGNAPYAIMVFTGLLPWLFFSAAVAEGGNSLVANSHLISKVYFPRIIIPISSVVVNLTDLLISSILLVGLMFWFDYWPTWRIIILPIFVLLAAVMACGVGLWLSALNVKYRDIRYIVPFALQIGMYVSPVGFSTAVVPEKWRLLYSLNPMVGIIDGFRWALLREEVFIQWPSIIASAVFSAMFLSVGIVVFRKTEKTFADII